MTALDLAPEQDAPTSPGFIAFAETMAQGPCLCAEIAEDDRPCLTCEAQAVLAQRGACEDCDGDGKVRDPAPDAPGTLPTTRCLSCTGGAS